MNKKINKMWNEAGKFRTIWWCGCFATLTQLGWGCCVVARCKRWKPFEPLRTTHLLFKLLSTRELSGAFGNPWTSPSDPFALTCLSYWYFGFFSLEYLLGLTISRICINILRKFLNIHHAEAPSPCDPLGEIFTKYENLQGQCRCLRQKGRRKIQNV